VPNAVKTMAVPEVAAVMTQEARQAEDTTQAVQAEDTTQAMAKLGAKRTTTLEVQTMSLRFRDEALGFRARSTRLALGVLGLQDLQALGPSAGGKALLVVP